MPSQHAHKSRGFRPDPEDFAAAEGNLKERGGRTVGAYLKACLRWCAEDPDAAIAAVDSRWPDIKPPGWPHVAPPAPPAVGKNPGREEDRSHPGPVSRASAAGGRGDRGVSGADRARAPGA